MPKYSVSEVLNIIKSLTAEERIELQRALIGVLSSTVSPNPELESPTQLQNMSGISISGSSSVALSQIEADRGSNASHDETRAAIQCTDFQAALNLLGQLKQDIAVTDALNLIEKKAIEIPIDTLEAELKRPKPDRSSVDKAVEALRRGLTGVTVLAEPVSRVAELIAKAWMRT